MERERDKHVEIVERGRMGQGDRLGMSDNREYFMCQGSSRFFTGNISDIYPPTTKELDLALNLDVIVVNYAKPQY